MAQIVLQADIALEATTKLLKDLVSGRSEGSHNQERLLAIQQAASLAVTHRLFAISVDVDEFQAIAAAYSGALP